VLTHELARTGSQTNASNLGASKPVSWLGMKQEAMDGWAKLHVHPHVMLLGHLTCLILALVTWAGIYFFGFPSFSWYIHVPAVVYLLTGAAMIPCAWSLGPAFYTSSVYKGMMAVAVPSIIYLPAAAYVGPIRWTPFQNRLHFTALHLVFTWLITSTGELGGTPSSHFHEPLTSLRAPLLKASYDTLRMIDAFTDAALVRVFVEQVQPPAPCMCNYWSCHGMHTTHRNFGLHLLRNILPGDV
jgi:hypothetical protein